MLSSFIHSYRNLIILDDKCVHKTFKNTSKFNTFPLAYRKKSSTLLNIPTLIKSLTDKFRFRARCCAPAKVAGGTGAARQQLKRTGGSPTTRSPCGWSVHISGRSLLIPSNQFKCRAGFRRSLDRGSTKSGQRYFGT